MYGINSRNGIAAPMPVILPADLQARRSEEEPLLHHGLAALEGLVTSLGGEIILQDAPPMRGHKGEIHITRLEQTEIGLLYLSAEQPDNASLLWGLDTADCDRLQRHILATAKNLPAENILEMDFLRVLNRVFIREHGELNDSDLYRISKARNIMYLARGMFLGKPVPTPGDTVRGSYYNGAFPFNKGVIITPHAAAEPGRITFCAEPYTPYLVPDSGGVDPSGGPFFGCGPEHLTFDGTEERLFWCFGHAGACGNGGIHFTVRVNRWTLSPDAGI